jgi:pimeloyl-ACP methyl ester carboxylesterase
MSNIPSIASVLGVALLAVALSTHAQPVSEGTVAPGAEGRLASVRDCELAWRRFGPAAPGSGPAVLIAHGFLRNGDFMQGWAEALASRGVTAFTVDLCASSTPGGRPADNGADLVALRKALGLSEVVYVGVSAGGLAALVAASRDPEATRGVLLLDPVNAGGQARSAAGRIQAPVAALVAKPQTCNAWRNIDRALHTLPDATIVRIDAASHCDFEWPTDQFCRVACLSLGTRERQESAEEAIRAIGLGFVSALAHEGDAGLTRWKAGIGSILPQ